MFIKAVNKDENVVKSVFVFIETTIIYSDVFLRTGRNGERLEESRLFVIGDLDSTVGMAVPAVLLDYRRDSIPSVLRRQELKSLFNVKMYCVDAIMYFLDKESVEMRHVKDQKAAIRK